MFLSLIVLMAAFLTEVYQIQQRMQLLDTERFQEHVVITAAYLNPEGRLVVNVTHQGSVTAKLVRLWVINQTANEHFYFNFSNLYITPGMSVSNVTALTLARGKDYAVRVVTERGNIASYNIAASYSGGGGASGKARLSIMASSTNYIGNNVTVVFCVTNNDTSGNNIYDLEPTMSVSPAPSLELLEGPTPSRVELLAAGSSVCFVYVYRVTGSGLSSTLNGSFVGAPVGNYVTTTIYAASLQVSVEVTSMPLVNLDAFGSIPALLDSTAGVLTYWGVALANPYNRSITVYSVAVLSTSMDIFDVNSLVAVNPASGWYSLRSSGVYSGVFWEASRAGAPITIPPFSTYNFTFAIAISSGNTLVIETGITVEAITTEGKFLKTFSTSAFKDYPAISLYLTRTPSSPLTDKQYSLAGVPASANRTFNVVIYNSASSNALTSKVNLLLLVPSGWSNVSAAVQSGWNFTSQQITQQNDGSWKITVESSSATLGAGSYLVYQFSAVTPAVSSTTLYVLAITAYYPGFSPSITSAYCATVVQVVP
ncbi:MAG: hypothetical protein ACQXXJ_04500 [Candidatus Bathyarchaeia archaeon]